MSHGASNSYATQSYQRQRQMTLGDLLLENRIVFLQGEIHVGNANEMVMKLLYLQSENRRKDIHFYINGDVCCSFGVPVHLSNTTSSAKNIGIIGQKNPDFFNIYTITNTIAD